MYIQAEWDLNQWPLQYMYQCNASLTNASSQVGNVEAGVSLQLWWSCMQGTCIFTEVQCCVYKYMYFVYSLAHQPLHLSLWVSLGHSCQISCQILCIFHIIFSRRTTTGRLLHYQPHHRHWSTLASLFTQTNKPSCALTFLFGNICFSQGYQQCRVDWGYFILSSFLNILKMSLLRLFSSSLAEWNPSFVLNP